MSNSHHATSGSSSSAMSSHQSRNPPDTPSRPHSSLRREVGSPTSAGSDVDASLSDVSTIAPSLLASRLGRTLYGTPTAGGSSSSLAESGFNTPTLALTGFNAISTVLNNPSKRQQPIDPKSSRYPAVTPNHVLAEIPKPKKAELEPYLSSIRPEWDRFMRNQSLGRQGKATLAAQQHQERQQQQSYDSEPLGKESRRHRTTASIPSLSADLEVIPPSATKKRLPLLSAVPQVFFKEEFDLGNPYTFDVVTERYKATTAENEQAGSVTPTYDVALNQMLQEKLSYYSDVVEQHLIIEIGQQSSSFFAALDNLNDLNAEAESCLSKIYRLKSEVQNLDHKQAKLGLKVVREQHKRRQLQQSQIAVQDVRQALERCELIRLLHQQGETEEALEMINDLRKVLRRTSAKSRLPTKDPLDGVTLSELTCLDDILPQLDEIESSLSGVLERDLIGMLRDDISLRLSKGSMASKEKFVSNGYFDKDTSLGDDSSLSIPGSGSSPRTPVKALPSPFAQSLEHLSSHDADLVSRLAPYIVGLARTGKMDKAMIAFRELARQSISETWKSILSQASDEMAQTIEWLLAEDLSKYDDHDNLPPPAAYLRDLDHSTFLSIGRALFDGLLDCLRAVEMQAKLIPRILDHHNSDTAERDVVDQTEDTGDTSTSTLQNMPAGVSPSLPAKMADVVIAATEQAHTLCARVLALRTSAHIAMELPQFLAVFELCWSFVLSSEQISRKMIVGLRGSVLGQAKGFLAAFHRKRIERAAKAVEEETWAQAEVGIEIQRQIRRIVESAVEDPAEFVITSASTSGSVPNGDAEEVQATEKTLEIEERQYYVVNASLQVLALLVDYVRVIINLPLLTTEAMARVVEFLKQFNSRTCQVVLGAGAMRSAGLKNITAKHLALASQSLSIMISLIPYIRETVRRHLSPKQAVMLTEFDKLRRDFQEHQYEIHAKLVAIMSDRLTVHCRTLSSIDWDLVSADEGAQSEPHKYAADLVKETATLHKVLSKYLHVPVVEHVIGQVLKAIDTRVAQEFDKVTVKNQSTRDRIVVDVDYLKSKLSTLKNVGWQGTALDTMLESKTVPTAPSSLSAPSTPVLDQGPATPTSEWGTNFPTVSYKPRIPNIFARRQQQQQSSPRGSMDSVPFERRASVEVTPRTSLQQQRTSMEVTSTPSGEARSLQDDAEDEVPPALPAKAVESTLEPVEEGVATTAEEELVAPVLPLPTPVREMLHEEASAVPVEVSEGTQDESSDPVADVVDTIAAAEVDSVDPPSDVTSRINATAPDISVPEVAHSVSEAEASPQTQPESKLSTPIRVNAVKVADISAPTTPTSSAGTPSKPGRMSLKERLAEAARKRAMQSNAAPVPATAAVVVEAPEKETAEVGESKEDSTVTSSGKDEADLGAADVRTTEHESKAKITEAIDQNAPSTDEKSVADAATATASIAEDSVLAKDGTNVPTEPEPKQGVLEGAIMSEPDLASVEERTDDGGVQTGSVDATTDPIAQESATKDELEDQTPPLSSLPTDVDVPSSAIADKAQSQVEEGEPASQDTDVGGKQDNDGEQEDDDEEGGTPSGDKVDTGVTDVSAKKKKRKNKKKKK